MKQRLQHLIPLFIYLLISLCPLDMDAIVYVNRVRTGSGSDCAYRIDPLIINGGVVWDTMYQNSYGACEGLDPGPPFILEARVEVVGGDLTVTSGEVIANWQIYVDSSHTFTLQGADLSIKPGARLLAQADGIIVANGATIVIDDFASMSMNFGGIGEFRNCTFLSATTNVINAFAPGSLFVDNCDFSTTGASASGVATINFTGNLTPATFRLFNSEFNTSAAEQNYVNVVTTLDCQISGNTFNTTTGYGVRLGTASKLIFENNTFNSILCPGGTVANDCYPVLFNDTRFISIRGNTGSGSTFNGMRMAFAGSVRPDGSGRIKSEPGFPFVSQTAFLINSGDSLFIEPGTVIKSSNGGSIICNGYMHAREVTFTSQKDTSVDGNTVQEFSPAPGDWRGISIIGPQVASASATFEKCTFRYAGSIDYTLRRSYLANLTVESCLLELGEGVGINNLDLNANEPNTFTVVRNSTIRYFETGISDNTFYPDYPLELYNNRIYGNGIGLLLAGPNSPIVDANYISGNRDDGIQFTGGGTPQMTNNIIAANGDHGLWINTPRKQDSVYILNNHLVGNQSSGISLNNTMRDTLIFMNNLFAYNQEYGLHEVITFTNEPIFQNNNFWGQGLSDVLFNNSLPEDVATVNTRAVSDMNVDEDPLFVRVDSGIVDSIWVDSTNYRTEVFVRNGGLSPSTLNECLFFDLNDSTVFFVQENLANSLILSDTAGSIGIGDTFYIWNLEVLDPNNAPLANLGQNTSRLTALDYLGNTRIQADTVDIGALESGKRKTTHQEQIVDLIWKAFPNPTTDILRLEANFPVKADARLSLYNMNGKLIQVDNWQESIDLTKLPKGLYILLLENGAFKSSKMIHVTH
ncbi:MAG: right-handed parallel beta-helix repeat-containing protein [Bacteroidota bacterium]